MSVPLRRFVRAVLTFSLLAGATSCGCPGFLNKNCSLDAAVALSGAPDAINGGRAFQVSVVLLRAEDAATSQTNKAWIREAERVRSTNRRVDFTVQSGEIRVPAGPGTDPKTTLKVSEDRRSVEIDFKGLGHPEEGGYARLAVFSDLRDRLESAPLIVDYGTIKAAGWKLALEIGAAGVQLAPLGVQ